MENIISKISEIESAAASIMDGANGRKQELSQDIAARTADFDRELERKTSEELEALRSSIEKKAEAQFEAEKSAAQSFISQLKELYDKNHTEYVKTLFEDMIKE